VLGYIDPNYFLGGRIKLDAGRAAAAVEAKVARPLGMDLYSAAWGVKEVVDGLMGQEIYRIAAMTSGLDPREFMIFAFGGAGPVHASGYAEAADVTRIAAFPFSSVAGAFGTLSLDLLQSYERTYSAMVSSHDLRIIDKIIPDLNAAIAELVTLGQRDMDEEGFAMGRIAFQLEVSMRFGQQRHSLPVPAPQLAFRDADDLRLLVDRFVNQYREAYGAEAVFIEAGVEILGLRLNAVAGMDKPTLPRIAEPPRETIRKGSRVAYWGPRHGALDTPVYDREGIVPGTTMFGPILVETADTVFVVPPEWTFRLDEYTTGWMERS
jgi:N-methylhydantoinase A/acetophenone carboxylase